MTDEQIQHTIETYKSTQRERFKTAQIIATKIESGENYDNYFTKSELKYTGDKLLVTVINAIKTFPELH
jgi:hypothetical protein